MDYQKHYNALMDKSVDRVIDGYMEKHHIIPRCLGGSDSKENLVALTAREHFVAHQLLVKIHPEESRLAVACFFMTKKSRTQCRQQAL